MPGSRRLLARLALVALSLAATLALLEVGLRIASRFVERERGGTGGRTTILCVGDSHTFGLHVLPSQSYPAQLQSILDPSQREIGVVNYGVPGRNSAALLARLPEYLDDVTPDLLLVLVGFDDGWNFEESGETGAGAWLASLRVARLLRLLMLNLSGDRGGPGDAPRVFEQDGRMLVEESGITRPAAVTGMTLFPIEGETLSALVTENVSRIVALARERGVTPVLLDYATENQSIFVDLNANARRLAASLGVPFVEVAIPFREAILRDGYSALFSPDDHPSAQGNRLVAEIVALSLESQGLVKRVAGSVAPAPRAAPELSLIAQDGAKVRLRVSGDPGFDFQVAFSPRTEPPIEIRGLRVPLGDDPMLGLCLENLNLRGRVGSDGSTVIDADLARIGAAAGQTLHGIVALFPPGADGLPLPSERLTLIVPKG